MKKRYALVGIVILLMLGMGMAPREDLRQKSKMDNNNEWGESQKVDGFSDLGYSEEELWIAYKVGRQHMVNHTILYENGMKGYIEEQYRYNYPNEMGLCLMAHIDSESITIYNHSTAMVWGQNHSSVSFGCLEEANIAMHSHPDIQRVWNMCYPSGNDVFSEKDYEMIVCGVEEDVTDVIAYSTEKVDYQETNGTATIAW